MLFLCTGLASRFSLFTDVSFLPQVCKIECGTRGRSQSGLKVPKAQSLQGQPLAFRLFEIPYDWYFYLRSWRAQDKIEGLSKNYHLFVVVIIRLRYNFFFRKERLNSSTHFIQTTLPLKTTFHHTISKVEELEVHFCSILWTISPNCLITPRHSTLRPTR